MSTNAITLTPTDIRTGAAVTINVNYETLGESVDKIKIIPIKVSNTEPYELALKSLGSSAGQTQLVFHLPGTYEIQAGAERLPFIVEEQMDLTFAVEFGLTVVLVTTLLMGLIRWNKKKRILKG